MPRPRQITARALTLQLQSQGVATAQQLADALSVDRSTVSRGLTGLRNLVLQLGAARSARYALRREVRGHRSPWPLYRITSEGRAETWAEMHAVHGGFWLDFAGVAPVWLARNYPDGFFPGLPFFLSDVRAQGFLGRALAREFGPHNGLPEDPRAWQDDDVLISLLATGYDLPGNVVPGTRMMDTLLRTRDLTVSRAIKFEDRSTRYPVMAAQAMEGGAPGSSAGGEQPKFLASLDVGGGQVREVLVKFSPPMDTPAGRRWGDLLAAEHHALAVLAGQGEEVAVTELLDAGSRRFLEVTRFDRSGRQGRRGVLTLQAIEAGLLDETVTDWPAAARAMAAAGLLQTGDADALVRRWCFGRQIGNTDMHFGNASVWFGDDEPFRLAPVYDMLPMLFVPGSQGEVVPRDFSLAPPRPELHAAWRAVTPWALEFWQRVETDETITVDFRQRAAQARTRVAEIARSL